MATNEIKIVLKGDDQASDDIKKVNKALGETGDESKKANVSFKNTFTEMASAVQLAQQAYQVLNEVIDQTVGLTVDYAAEVRDLSRASGMGAEETSKIIQLFDDMNVESEVLTQSLRKMSQEGITFSVDKMAEMSDEYLKLAEGAERNKYLLDNFGRSGLEMAKALEIGGDAIKGMAGEMDGSLILTQENVDAAREYEIQMDDLEDAVMGVKVSIGNRLIPILADAAEAFLTIYNAQDNVVGISVDHIKQVELQSDSYESYRDELERTLEILGITITDTDNLKAVNRAGGMVIEEVKDKIVVLTEEEWLLLSATQNLIPQTSDLGTKFLELNGVLPQTVVQMDAVYDATLDANLAMKDYSASLLFALSGVDPMSKAGMDLAESMGLIDDKTRFAIEQTALWTKEVDAGRMSEEMKNQRIRDLGIYLDSLTSKDITITTHHLDTYTVEYWDTLTDLNTQNGSGNQRAAGGPVRPNQTYIVGENGPEILQMGTRGGNVIPMSNVTNNYNLGVTTMQSANVVQSAFSILEAMA